MDMDMDRDRDRDMDRDREMQALLSMHSLVRENISVGNEERKSEVHRRVPWKQEARTH
jgi:hypothetical protein